MAMNGPWHFYKCWSFTSKVQNNFKLLKKNASNEKGREKKKILHSRLWDACVWRHVHFTTCSEEIKVTQTEQLKIQVSKLNFTEGMQVGP